MAIYHCSIKTISRSQGRSATAAAAYRDGERIVDERTGEIHDYTKKQGVEYTEIIMPPGVAQMERGQLWNAAEAAEARKNSTVAREYELALPDELNQGQRQVLALEFARHLADNYGVAAGVAIHAPGQEGDHRNHHAHILTTTRQVGPGGEMGAKTRILDDRNSGEVERIRATWAQMVNQSLERAGSAERVSHESLKQQSIDRQPSIHMGPTATAMERRGVSSDRGEMAREIAREPTRPGHSDEVQATPKAKEAAAKRVVAKKDEVMAKVARYKYEKEEKAKAERRAQEAQEKRAKLQKEKEAAEKAQQTKNRSRGPGMGRGR